MQSAYWLYILMAESIVSQSYIISDEGIKCAVIPSLINMPLKNSVKSFNIPDQYQSAVWIDLFVTSPSSFQLTGGGNTTATITKNNGAIISLRVSIDSNVVITAKISFDGSKVTCDLFVQENQSVNFTCDARIFY